MIPELRIPADLSPALKGEEWKSNGRHATIHDVLLHPELLQNEEWLGKQDSYLLKTYDLPQPLLGQPGLEQIKKAVESLEARYPEYLPDHLLVQAGQNAETAKVYMLMEKVVPETLDRQKAEVFASQLDQLLSRIIADYSSSYNAELDTGFIPDINEHNLVFGTTTSSKASKLFLVDLYPLSRRTKKELIFDVQRATSPFLEYSDFQKTQQALRSVKNNNHLNHN